jgi:hypothetical protein
MSSGLGAGLGADMLQDILRQKFTEAITRQKLAEDARQANQRNEVERGTLALGNRRTDEDVRQFDMQAPTREANVAHLGASTESLNRAPVEAQKGRDFTAGESQKGRDFTGGQGDANRNNAVRIANINGSNALRVANVRHPDTAAAGPTEKEQNEVEDSLALIKQIRDDKARASSTGPLQGRGLGALADFEGYTRVKALHDNLVNKLQLAQAGKLKGQGQISNMEREMLKNAATALDRNLGDGDYLNELGKVEAQFQRMLSGPRATTAPAGAAPKGSGFKVVEIK